MWYRMASRQNWEGWENVGGHGWDMDGSNTERVEYEPWMSF